MSILILLAVLVALYFIIYFCDGFFNFGFDVLRVYLIIAMIILIIASFVKWKNERKFLFLWLIISVVLCFGKRYLSKPDDGYQWVKTNCSNCGKNCICDIKYYVDETHVRQKTPQGSPVYICSQKCSGEYWIKSGYTSYGTYVLYPKINGKYDTNKHYR